MSDVAPQGNPINFKALSSFEVDAVYMAGMWYTCRTYKSIVVEPVADPNVDGAWLGLYRVVVTDDQRVFTLVVSKEALLIGETKET